MLDSCGTLVECTFTEKFRGSRRSLGRMGFLCSVVHLLLKFQTSNLPKMGENSSISLPRMDMAALLGQPSSSTSLYLKAAGRVDECDNESSVTGLRNDCTDT